MNWHDYPELAQKRPTKNELISKIWIKDDKKPTPEEVIHVLYEAKRKNGYNKIWVDTDYAEDEYGNPRYYYIVVYGNRDYTDKEWLDDLNLALFRTKGEKETHKNRDLYFAEGGRHEELVKKLESKMNELKGEKK